jgi:hypothetical protein
MAINHNINVNIQITLSKEDNQNLETILKDLKSKYQFDFTKSKAISFLIRKYAIEQCNIIEKVEQKPVKTTIKKELNQNQEPKKMGQIVEKLKAFKQEKNLNNVELSKVLNIPEGTIKKYLYCGRTPTGENERKIIDFLNKEGIE